jgi:hypothetical protein
MNQLGFLALGAQEIDRLVHAQHLDLDLTMGEIIGLGRNVYDRYRAQGHELVLDPAGLAILEEIALEREKPLVQAQTAPEAGYYGARGIEHGPEQRQDQGQGDHAPSGVQDRHVRNETIEIRDHPDENWS